MQPCQRNIDIFMPPLGSLVLHGQPCWACLAMSSSLTCFGSGTLLGMGSPPCRPIGALGVLLKRCGCVLQISQSPAVAIRSSMPMTPAAALNGTHNRDFAIQMAAHHTVCEGSFLE